MMTVARGFGLMALLATAACTQSYFPEATWGPDGDADEFRREWYSKHLSALQEPSLQAVARDPRAEVYRFLWLRSFDQPVALRVHLSGRAKIT
ncbi:MAG: hypothetical protein DWQ30_20035 [Acidobacteria bacterium]|nr:MAG: hypothetical protein DWQ30_20035 [Acidobacteriota bacterium]